MKIRKQFLTGDEWFRRGTCTFINGEGVSMRNRVLRGSK